MKATKHLALFFLTALLAVHPFFSFSQKLTASASATSIGLNNTVQLTYTMTGGQAESFQGPSFNGFKASGPYQSSSSNIIISNGKTVTEVSVSWIYSIAPTKAGKFTIDPAKAKVKGQWIASNPITIDVSNTGTPKQNQNQQTTQTSTSSTDLFIKASTDKTSAVQGEQITVVYKVYFRVPISSVSPKKLPSFAGFWSTEIGKPDDKIKQYVETYNGLKYNVGEFRKIAIFPQKTGKLTIDPMDVEVVAQVKVKSQVNDPFGFFGGMDTYGIQEVLKNLKSNAINITVSELPATNKPDDFSGFVGSLNMDTKVDKHEVKAGEAINLTFTLSGKGNLSLLDKMNIEFPPDFEVYDPQISENISTATGEVSGSKTFNYLIIPRTQGNFKLKPVTLSYYDKNKKSYVTLSSGEIDIKVNKGDGSAASVTGGSNKEDIKYINSDIKFIDNKVFEVYPIGRFFFASIWYYILMLLPVVLFIVFIVMMRRRIKLRSNVTLLKHKKATKIALKRLKQANIFMKAADKNNFYIELSRALWGYISDKFSIPLANLSLDSAQTTLAEKNVSENIRNKFIEILNNCEFARFAPAEANVTMESIYNDAVAIISQTEQELK
jgi:hypothetical protein